MQNKYGYYYRTPVPSETVLRFSSSDYQVQLKDFGDLSMRRNDNPKKRRLE